MRPALLASRLVAAHQRGGIILLAGCGGFHAHACHMAAELVVRYRRDRAPVRAIALGCNPAITTAAVNDLGPEAMLARELDALATPGRDLLMTYSTSGRSPMLLALLGRPGLETIVRVEDQEAALRFDHKVCAALEALL